MPHAPHNVTSLCEFIGSSSCESVVISKNFNKEGSRHNHAMVWVWPSYNHAHIFKDGNIII